MLPNISRAQTLPVAVSDTLQLRYWRLVRAGPLDSIVNNSSKAFDLQSVATPSLSFVRYLVLKVYRKKSHEMHSVLAREL